MWCSLLPVPSCVHILPFSLFLPLTSAQVIIEYDDMASAIRARNAMHGRKFAGRSVIATYLPEEHYVRGEFDYVPPS